ncbi:hypothetical protein [Thermoflavimicrobium daqui]|uniref:Uncharacterized protein n=1 Tax=Thermoflavimicrobium daqui TaxID=2137476 RepID=A0A364K1R8_9BACL|nr:hypothetical protein [Thermoflavimicrobium daqui]RAL21978.1 hypothetical protein DL897_15455 [Thermoflavimicrobium daqui]
MQNWYKVDQMARIRQQEMCQELCNIPRLSKESLLDTFIQQIRQFFREDYPKYLHEQLCCLDKI